MHILNEGGRGCARERSLHDAYYLDLKGVALCICVCACVCLYVASMCVCDVCVFMSHICARMADSAVQVRVRVYTHTYIHTYINLGARRMCELI